MKYILNNVEHDYNIIKPIGNKVLLKKLVNKIDKKYGDILIPQEYAKNNSFGIAEVIDLGNDESIKDSGLKIGDYVLYDYYSVFNDNPEYVITEISNIVLQVTKEEATELSKTKITY